MQWNTFYCSPAHTHTRIYTHLNNACPYYMWGSFLFSFLHLIFNWGRIHGNKMHKSQMYSLMDFFFRAVPLFIISNFVEIWFTYYKINPLKAYDSIIFRAFPELCNHHHNPIWGLLEFSSSHRETLWSISILFYVLNFSVPVTTPQIHFITGSQLQMTNQCQVFY